jgi:hypothetical protein
MLRDAPRDPARAEEPGRAEEGDSVGLEGEVSAERPREEVARERAGELDSLAWEGGDTSLSATHTDGGCLDGGLPALSHSV